MKVHPFESAYNGAYKELNFICQQCFLTHALCTGAGAGVPEHFAGAGVGKLQQKLRQTKL